MRRFRFPLAVLGTSLLLVLGIGVAGYFTVTTALAQGWGPFGGHLAGRSAVTPFRRSFRAWSSCRRPSGSSTSTARRSR